MKKFRHNLVMLFFTALIVSCSNDDAKKAAPVLKIPVIDVIQKDIPIYSEFVGQTYGRKDIPIRARVDGFLEGIYFKEGSRVKKGQLLYRIEPQSLSADLLAAKSKVAEAETNVANAKSELDRVKPLAEMNAVSKSELDNANARYKSALAQLESAKANMKVNEISLSYSELKSPIDGLIGMTKAKVGEYVGKEPNPVILNTVSKIDTILVRFYVTESVFIKMARVYSKALKDADKGIPVKREDQAKLKMILADGSIYAHEGAVDFVDNNIDASTGALLAQASFPNPDRVLRPGMFARVRAEMETRKGAILIPQRSILFIQGQPRIMIVGDDNTVESKSIVLGAKYHNLWEVTSGLKPTDKIVYQGAQKLRSGDKIDPTDSDFKEIGE